MTYAQVLALIQQFIVANGNNEITANVLRPILEAILAQPNELIGDLGELQTTDQSNLVSAINEVLESVLPPIGSINTKIHPLSLFGIDPDLPELTKIAEAVKLQGPFTCDEGQQMVFRTISTVGTQENGTIVTRYYRLLRNLTTIGGVGVGQPILPSWFMPDGVSEYANPDADGTIIELGDIGTSEVWDVFNLGNNGEAWDMNEYRFVRATQNGGIQLWAFVGQERYYGGPDMGVEPDIFEAFESDFFLITDQPVTPSETPTLQQVTEQGNITSEEIIHSKTYETDLSTIDLKAIIGSESRVIDEGGGIFTTLITPFLKLLRDDFDQVKFDFRGLNFTLFSQDYTQYTRYGDRGIHIEREYEDSPTDYRNILIPQEIVNQNNILPLTVNNIPADDAGNISIPNAPIIIVITPLGEPLTTGDVEYTFTAPYDFNLANYWISAQVAPIGSGITVRLKVNGTYIDSTGTTIPTGDYDSLTSLPTITTPTIVKGDRITAEITAVGSTYEGEGLTLYLES